MTPPLLGAMAARTGVPETRIRTGMSAATTALLDDLAERARDPHAMFEVANLIEHSPDVTDPQALLEQDAPARERGNQLIGLATDDVPGLVERLGSLVGIGASAATALASTAGGLLVGAFRNLRRARGGLDAPTLASSLAAEQSAIHAAVPVGLLPVPAERRALPWLLALTAISLAILLGIFLLARPHRPAHEVGAPTAPAPPAAPATALPPESAEARLLAHAASSRDVSPWFALRDVEFETGNAALPPAANAELDRIARVLRDYPDLRVGVTGYGDNLGSADEERALAQGRADTIRRALIARGVAGDRIEATAGGQSNRDAAIRVLPAA